MPTSIFFKLWIRLKSGDNYTQCVWDTWIHNAMLAEIMFWEHDFNKNCEIKNMILPFHNYNLNYNKLINIVYDIMATQPAAKQK